MDVWDLVSRMISKRLNRPKWTCRNGSRTKW